MGLFYPQDSICTNPSQRPPSPFADQTDNKYISSIPTNHMHKTYTSPTHTSNTYLQQLRISVHPNRSYPIISTEPVTIPARTNTIMTTRFALPHSKNSLFESSQEHFVDQPVQCTPAIVNAENGNLPVHFINHSDHEDFIPKESYVEAMKEVEELDQDISHTNSFPEPASQHTLSKCLRQSDILPNQCQQVHCITNSTSTVTIPTSDIYQRYQLFLNKEACWMTIFILITANVFTAVASHTDYHFKPPFKEPDKPIVSPTHTLTWRELLAYGTRVHLKIRL